MLVEEIEKRSGIRWSVANDIPAGSQPIVMVGLTSSLKGVGKEEMPSIPGGEAPESYRIWTRQAGGKATVTIAGTDSRGVLFGVGRLLREMRMDRGSVQVRETLRIGSAPKYALRGHQLGYRPKCNSYDAWDLPVWEQYIRDLVVFGCNAIELIPPRSDDDADSPHFPRPPMEMMVGVSQLAKDYGLDLWVWYPAMDKNYANPDTVSGAVREWAEVLRRLPKLDAIFVPGGDPGHTQPKHLIPMLAKQAASVRQFHPEAKWWISPQGFTAEWMEEFLQILRLEDPAWLHGIVFGPQVRMNLPKLRETLPARFPIRHYPDITHTRQCEYPVPDWDLAFAVTEGRECINPRPEDQAVIFRQMQPYTIGFLTYSEGCNDDVNKIIWSGLGWDPSMEVIDILRDYARYFVGERNVEGFAQGIMALERNWRGSLLGNENVETTLAQFRAMEGTASPRDLRNWRFQQALLRAYYDAYVRRRLIHETAVQQRALERLAANLDQGSGLAMSECERDLDSGLTTPIAEDLRGRVSELSEALFQSIGMQLSVRKYAAIAVDRGACLDTIDFPLNDRLWLKDQFSRIRQLPNETTRADALKKIIHWTNPGPGGFYDDLGNPACQPHLVRGGGFAEDPGAMLWPRSDFEEDLVIDEPDENPGHPRRRSWMDHAETLYDGALEMRYSGLDPAAKYRLRVVYAGDSPKKKIRLEAGEGQEVHPLMKKPFPYEPIEFALPPSATTNGELRLRWTGEPGLGGNGRACQVSEVWLIKQPN
jgi:hypothetical protein